MRPAAIPDLKHCVPEFARLNALTDRKTGVLQVIVASKSNKEIARDLDICTRTVEMHRAAAMAKLGVNSLPALRRILVQSAIAPGEPFSNPVSGARSASR